MKKQYTNLLLGGVLLLGCQQARAQLVVDGTNYSNYGYVSNYDIYTAITATPGSSYDAAFGAIFDHNESDANSLRVDNVYNANGTGGSTDNFNGPLGAAGVQGISGSVAPNFSTLVLKNGAASLFNITNTAGANVFIAADFQNGITTTARANTAAGALRFQDGATYTGGTTDTQHVNGYVGKVGDDAFVFPVGSGTDSRTLAIAAPAIASAQLTTAYDTTNVESATAVAGPIQSVYTLGSWDWAAATPIDDDGLAVTVSIPDVSGFASTANLRLVGWNGTQWIDLSGSAAASGNAENSTLSGTIPAGVTITQIGIGSIELPLAPQPKFACSALSYVIGNRNIAGSNVSDAYTLNLSSGAATLAKADLIAGPNAFVNAIGYNTVDNYIWGFRYNTHELVRIGSDWSVQLFPVTGFPTSVPGFATGDVSPAGILYLYAANAGTITKVDLNPGSANYLVAVTVPTTPTNLNDWSFNPVDGLLYAFGTDKILYQFDPVTGTRTTLGPVTGGGIESQVSSFGTAFFSESGDFFVGNNLSGAIFKIAAPLTNLTASAFSTTSMSPGDGARCANASVIDPPVAVNDSTSAACSAVMTNVLANDIPGTAPLVLSTLRIVTPGTLERVTSLNIPGEGQYVVNTSTGEINFTPVNGFKDTTSIQYVLADTNNLEAQATLTIVVDCPLPVTLVSFSALAEGQTALLTWATTEETNSDRFEVERSMNGKTWQMIGSVAANGESTVLRNYSFIDLHPSSGENLYRLRMVDRDETFAYSRVRELNFGGVFAQLHVFPNPVSDKLYLKDPGKVAALEIIDMSGQSVFRSTTVTEAGINVKHFTAGMYVVRTTTHAGQQSSQKILIHK